MNFLSISASQSKTSLSYFTDNEERFCVEVDRLRQPSFWFVSALDFIKEQFGDFLDKLDYIAVDVGPGSFTGIKVAIAFVKGLAIPNNIKIVSVDSLSAYFLNMPDVCKFAVLLDARRGLHYYAVYEKKEQYLNAIIKPSVGDIETINKQINKLNMNKILFTGDNVLNEKGIKFIKKLYPHSKGIGYLSIKHFESNNVMSIKDLIPMYIRKTEAEINLEKKSNC